MTCPRSPSTSTHPPAQDDLQMMYEQRFGGLEDYRRRVWRVLYADFFEPFVRGCRAVLDVGCGYGEFINQVQGPACYAMDLNPSAGRHLNPTVEWFQQDCSQPWPLPDASLDLIFSSNFFEHLPDEPALRRTIQEAHRCLRPGGRLIALGPNLTYVGPAYWDFSDHHLALTEDSLGTVLRAAGFSLQQVIPRFLPYTMSDGRRYPLFLVRLYLRLPIVWRLLGRQFLVVASKPAP